jgi:hypothetical protein
MGGNMLKAMTPKQIVCSYVRDLIHDLRDDMFLAMRLDDFVDEVNYRIKADAEWNHVEPPAVATADDVKQCIKYYDDVKIIDSGGVEVLWLWSGWYAYYLTEAVARVARRYRGGVLAMPDKPENVVEEPHAEE